MVPGLATLAALLLSPEASAGPAWDAMQRGLQSYGGGDYAAAATNFDAAATAAAKEKFDPAVAAFDRANALLMAGKARDAAHVYEEALRTTDLGLQGRTYHNRGNALLGVAGEHEQQQKFEDAIKSVDEAMAMYERSMMLAPKDADPKINYELAGLKRKELEEKLKEQQQQQQQNQDNKDEKKDEDQQKQDSKDQQDQKDQDQKDQQQSEDRKDGQQDKQDQQGRDQKPQNGQPEEQDGQKEQQRQEQMTPQEAAMLLDAMKQREQAQREQLGQIWLKRSNAGKMQPVDKDW